MLLTPVLLTLLPSLVMGTSLPFLTLPPFPFSTFSFTTLLPVRLRYDSISMEIGQVYQAVPPPAKPIVHCKRATFLGLRDPRAPRAHKTLNTPKMVRKVRKVTSEEKWEAVYDSDAPVVEERSWDKKRITARLGKRGSQLKNLVFVLSSVKRRNPALDVVQVPVLDLLAGLAAHHWEKRKQGNKMLKQRSPLAEAFKFARVV